MSNCNEGKTPHEHIAAIFKEYTTPSRVLRSFTNLSNTVIQTALSGQNKFVYEILQNADDSFEDEHQSIEVQFILEGNYLIVHHNGKGFDYNDVERICDYASQIEEVKANDLSKTGYKGLGFKSLFNLSDCIYIHSNGYSFRFDKTHWPDISSRPWQVVPIWTSNDDLPLKNKYKYDESVNFILKINDVKHLQSNLQELVEQPEALLYLHRIHKISLNSNGKKYHIERKIENFGIFNEVDIYTNRSLVSTWLLRTYERIVPQNIRNSLSGASRFIYPDKIKTAKTVSFTFALRSNELLEEISKIKGLCHSTLPTQLHLKLPYHINSLFILNLDRTQLHENEWNEFLIYQIGILQFSLLKDLAEIPHLRNYVIMIYVREIKHFYTAFNKAFEKGFNESKRTIAWLPAYQGSRLLKLGDAWIDETKFFKQNFQNVRDNNIQPYLIDYDVKEQCNLQTNCEAKRFTYDDLINFFPKKYYHQLTKSSHRKFIKYMHEIVSGQTYYWQLKCMPFLRGKYSTLLSPEKAFLEEVDNPIPDFLKLDPVDNDYLPSDDVDSVKDWLVGLDAKRLSRPIEVVRESILKWLDYGNPKLNYERNHIEIINYLAKDADQLTYQEIQKLQNKLLILTESKKFEKPTSCYFPDAVSVAELADVISDDNKVSSRYDMHSLHNFFIYIGVNSTLEPLHVLQIFITWIKKGEIKRKLTASNYIPIIEYISKFYSSIKDQLTSDQKEELRNTPILTSDQTFQKAKDCYFETAVIDVKGLDCIIPKNKLISTKNISTEVCQFLVRIGVSENMLPIEVLRQSILKWIKEGQIRNRINSDNHYDILKYIAGKWENLSWPFSSRPNEKERLDLHEKTALKRIPILTKSNTFRAACDCYRPKKSDDTLQNTIPGLESIFSPDELVSSVYDDSTEIIKLLYELDVRDLKFADIYEKYSAHLNTRENLEWFFSNLKAYWLRNSQSRDNDKLLKDLRQKFKSSRCLLAKNNEMYSSTDLYSSEFESMHAIDADSVPLLHLKDTLCGSLEEWLGFKKELELECIIRLLEAVREKPDLLKGKKDHGKESKELGKESKEIVKESKEVGKENTQIGKENAQIGRKKTQTFFTTILKELTILKKKNKNEIKLCSFNLLSQDNKMKLAKELYYFEEEKATCYLDSCYLKRIHGMSHKDTLELAELCGVNILPFKQEPKFGEGEQTPDNTLKEYYLKRLPFIVLQESKELNESPSDLLKSLYDSICSIQLYRCPEIFIQYPFGEPHKVRFYFEGLKIYTTGRWKGFHKIEIHEHLKKELGFKTDTRKTIEMELNSEDREEWLEYKNESPEKLQAIEEELQQLRSKENASFPVEEIDKSDSLGKDLPCENESLSVDRLDETRDARIHSGENLLPIMQDITFGERTPDDTLKEFYLERLPFIVLQESKAQTKSFSTVLTQLYSKISSIESYNCCEILVQCPTGNPCEIPSHFEGLKIYTKGRWSGMQKSKIHKHLSAEFSLETDITEIIDMDPNTDKEQWLCLRKESFENLHQIEQELLKLRLKGEDSSFVQAEKADESLHSGTEKDTCEEVEENQPSPSKSPCNENPTDVSVEAKPSLQIQNAVEVKDTAENDRSLIESEIMSCDEVICRSAKDITDTKELRRSEPITDDSPTNQPIQENAVCDRQLSESVTISSHEVTCRSEEMTQFNSEGLHPIESVTDDNLTNQPITETAMHDRSLSESNGISDHEITCRSEDDIIKLNTKGFHKRELITGLTSQFMQETTVCERILNESEEIPREDVTCRSEDKDVEDNSRTEGIVNVNIRLFVEGEREIDRNVRETRIDLQHPEILNGQFSSIKDQLGESLEERSLHSKEISLSTNKGHYESDELQKLAQSKFSTGSNCTTVNLRRKEKRMEHPRSDFTSVEKLNIRSLKCFESGHQKRQMEHFCETNNFLLDNYYINIYSSSQANLAGRQSPLHLRPAYRKHTSLNEMQDDIKDSMRWLVRMKQNIGRNRAGYYIRRNRVRIQHRELYGSNDFSRQRAAIKFLDFLQQDNNEKSQIKWLGEKCVFTFLQEHYKNKYPNSQFDLSGGTFTLHFQQSRKIEVIWLNESDEKGFAYDILLKKDNEIRQLIEVESANVDSFNLSHSEFNKRMNCVANDLQGDKEKFCIYRVFNIKNSSAATFVPNLNSPSAVYKIVPLNIS